MKKAEKIMMEGDNSGILGEHTLVLSMEGIVQTLPESEQKILWKGIKKMEETQNYFFLYNSSISAIIIPKHKISNELAEVDKMLMKYLK